MNNQTEFIANNIDPVVIRQEWNKLVSNGKPWLGLLIKILIDHKPKKSLSTLDKEQRERYKLWNVD